MGRIILHSDLNAFYASVEQMLHPELKGKPLAVCGSVEDRHGIVLTKSQQAKEAGVKTGMAIWQAKQLHLWSLLPSAYMLSPPQVRAPVSQFDARIDK